MTDDTTQDVTLAADFPPATREDWLKLVRNALKDRPYERLISKTYDGLTLEPLYARAQDAQPIAARKGPWQVMQRVDHPDAAAANDQALHDLENGATGLTLVFKGAVGDTGFGLDATETAIARVLDGVYLDAAAIELDLSPQSKDAGRLLASLVRAKRVAPASTDIRFGYDPIGAMALGGGTPLPWSEIAPVFSAAVSDLVAQGFRGPFAPADGRVIHNAGGSEAQELAFVLAVAVTYLRALESGGMTLDRARRMIFFRLSADADQFLTIGKFRALRKLWARVEQACGLEPLPVFVSAETAWRMMTRRDPHVNMLRTTIAAFSAGIGGADAVAVLPFSAALGLPDRFARRVARNSQLLLLEESNLAKVSDPAAGSGGFEALTEQLCTAAWAMFREIERTGGVASALEAGLIQDKVAAVRAQHMAAVASRKDPLTGTSEYPNLSETPATVLDVKPAQPAPYPSKIKFAALTPLRLAEPFEQLRDLSDAMASKTGSRPRIFLANLGTLAEFNARASFAKNFFESGGIEAAMNDGFKSRDELIAAFKASGATLACLCSSDDGYAREAVDAAKALTAAGAHVILAGRPGALEQPLREAGVADFIFAGCNALTALQAAHARIASGR